MQSFKGKFTATAAPTTGTQAITGVGFTPDVLIFWQVSTLTTGTWATASPTFSFGVAVSGGNQHSMSGGHFASTTDNCSTRLASGTTTAILLSDRSGGDNAHATVQSFDSNGFTLNWQVNTTNPGYVIHFIALAGVSASACGTFQVDGSATGTTGNQTFSLGGSTPDALLFFHPGDMTSIATSSSSHAGWALGVIDKNGNQWARASQEKTAVREIGGRAQRTDRCMIWLDQTTVTTIAQEASFVSLGAGSFTLNFPTVFNHGSGLKSRFIALSIVGCNSHAGSFNKNTATGAQVVSSGLKPELLLMGSYMLASSSSVDTIEEHTCLGASDGTNSGYTVKCGVPALNSGPTSSNYDSLDNTNGILGIADRSDDTLDDLATLTSFDVGGTFTLNWTTSSAVAREVTYLALASTGVAGSRIAQNFFVCRD